MPDVIVTGLPRSGLTTVAALVDYLPNAVCLNAPAAQISQLARVRNAVSYAKWLTGDFAWVRARLQRRESVSDWRAADGSPLLDGIKDTRRTEAPVAFTRPKLKDDFILGMKQHSLYTSLLPTLVKFNH